MPRLLPRLPFHRRRSGEEPLLGEEMGGEEASGEELEEERSRRLLVQLGVQIVTVFMVVAALLYWVVASLLGTGIIVPTSAGGVLGSVSVPAYYSWSSESVRVATLAGNQVQYDAYRSAVVDLRLNKSQDLTIGVFPQTFIWLSDGHLTASYTTTNQQSGSGWQLVTNVCAGKPAVPASLLQMPSPQDIEAAQPKLISDQGTVFGVQSWVMSFTPTPTILRKIFWIAFYDAVTSATPAERDWVLSPTELAAINSGHIKLVYAYAWVTRSPRLLRQVELKFYTDKGKSSGYRFLIKMFPDQGEPLQATSFGKSDCGGATVGSTSKGPTLAGQQPKAPAS